jgi:NADH-quinone oxidoreductase subunit L
VSFLEEAIVFPYIRWIPLLPLLGFLINGLGARANLSPAQTQRVHWVGCLAPFGSLLISIVALLKLLELPPEGRLLTDTAFTWIAAGDFTARISFSIDPLSSIMTLTVTSVGFLIHVYSVGYMHGDRGYARYFAYLNLFMAMMLILVLGNNLLLLFLGWEGVGLCSYFLIGFWYEDPEKAYAGLKAFVVNRIGDFGFLLGLFLLFWSLGQKGVWTIDFAVMQEHIGLLGPVVVSTVCLLLFMGAMGKSAQIPLYVWLPDAMAGPTPVSALIHAATMVTAGVYMVARMHFVFVASDLAMLWVAWIGASTALFAATVGLCQNDIKKVLAYSTVSQLGYMFVGVGVGAYAAGIHHLVTHAFFKALLFLGAGSVMHAMGNETDIRKMGGLRKKMPWTFWTFLIATLAITGFPPLSGFFSKDEILWQAYASHYGSTGLWFVLWVGAALTSLYMFRLVFLTFFGEPRDHHLHEHAHESPAVMTVPLVLLAVGSAVTGFLGIPPSWGVTHVFEHFLTPVVGGLPHGEHVSHGTEWTLLWLSVAVAVAGLLAAWWLYLRSRELPNAIAQKYRRLYELVYNKYYVDELYDALFVRPIRDLSEKVLWRIFDAGFIDDGLVNGTARFFQRSARSLRLLQAGDVQSYAVAMVVGILAIIGFLLLQ